MKKIFSIAAIAALTIGAASCAKEGGSNATAEGSGLLKIKLVTGGTRAPITDNAAETLVQKVEVFIFDAGGAALAEEGEGQTNYIESNGVGTIQAFVPGGNKDILVIANANIGEPAADATMEGIMNTLSEKFFDKTNSGMAFAEGFVMAGQTLNVAISETEGTDVSVYIDRNVAKVTPPTKATNVTFKLTKEQWVEIYGEENAALFNDPTAVNTDATFELLGYAVLNGLPKSHVGFAYVERSTPAGGVLNYHYDPRHNHALANPFSYSNEWLKWDHSTYTYTGSGSTAVISIPTHVGTTETELGERLISAADDMMDDKEVNEGDMERWAPYAKWLYYDGTDNAAAEARYVYESRAGEATNAGTGARGYHHDQVISYVIGGTINPNIDGVPAVDRYWRVDIRKGEAFHILRNSLYSVEVANIITPGSGTPWEAENEKPIIDEPVDVLPADFIISINPWNARPVGNDGL